MALPTDLTDPQTYPILPGISFFAKKTSTEGDDEDEDDDEDDDDFDVDADDKGKKGGDDEDDDEDEDEDTELPDTVKEILKKNRRAASAAEKRARVAEGKLRDALKKAPKKKAKEDDEDDEDDDEKAARLSAPAIKLAKRTKAEGALARAGLNLGDDEEASFRRAVRLLDLDELELDIETGRVDGLADAIADLKDDMPSLFSRTRSKRKINGDDDRGREPKPRKKLTATEAQAEQLKPGSVTGRRS